MFLISNLPEDLLIISASISHEIKINGTILGLGKFLTTDSPIEMMKNAFYFTLKVLFLLKIFKFLS